MNPRAIAEQVAAVTIAEEIQRRFVDHQHMVDVLDGPMVPMYDDAGNMLPGIVGRPGAWGTTLDGHEFGADLIEMQSGSAFPLHTYQGDHLLFVVSGRGFVHIDGVDRPVRVGDTIFIAAEHAHSVKTDPAFPGSLAFMAIGIPHKHIQAYDRMTVVRE